MKSPAGSLNGTNQNIAVRATAEVNTPEQFQNILLRTNADGTAVRLKDVARVEVGSSGYGFALKYNDTTTSGFGVQLLTGANALGVDFLFVISRIHAEDAGAHDGAGAAALRGAFAEAQRMPKAVRRELVW